jgi:hypothetical protein
MARRLTLAFTFVAVPPVAALGAMQAAQSRGTDQVRTFQKAFSCKPGAPMVRANACRVW